MSNDEFSVDCLFRFFQLTRNPNLKVVCSSMWSACHKKSYLTNLEVRNLKSEISCLCPVWLSHFCLFWKKMGKSFVKIPKFVNSTHNKYLLLWHADHIKLWKCSPSIWNYSNKVLFLNNFQSNMNLSNANLKHALMDRHDQLTMLKRTTTCKCKEAWKWILQVLSTY